MSVASFDVQKTITGVGSLSSYTFDFSPGAKANLLVVKRDDSGAEVARVRGTDTVTLISSVTLNSDGGGTIVLLSNLETDYILDIFMDIQEPTQDSSFKNKFDFTLKNIETALDLIVRPLQWVKFLATRSVKLKDVYDIGDFDVNLPDDIIGSASLVLGTNATGDALEMGPSFTEIANAQGYALAAAAAQTDAETAQAAAEAAQAAAELAQAAAENAASTAAASAPPAVTTAITNGMAAVTITNGVTPYTFDPGDTQWVSIECSIYRGTTVIGRFWVEVIYDGSAWNIFESTYNYPTGKSASHGLTFTMSGNSVQVAADSVAGSGNLITRAFQG